MQNISYKTQKGFSSKNNTNSAVLSCLIVDPKEDEINAKNMYTLGKLTMNPGTHFKLSVDYSPHFIIQMGKRSSERQYDLRQVTE